MSARPLRAWAIAGLLLAVAAPPTHAADHLDTPTVTADPAADIGDLFAWTSADGRRLNLAMTIASSRFSDQLQYVFHVDSGARFGATTASAMIVCRFDVAAIVECWAGEADHLRGDVGGVGGREGERRRFRVFAGLRDDPFFNNVKGTRAALAEAAAALGTAYVDVSGCPWFTATTTREILDRWRHTDSGPATNFLAGWTSASLVVAADLDVVAAGGRLLAVWASVHEAPPTLPRARPGAPPVLGPAVERMGRPLIGNGLLAPLAPGEVSERRKEEYNRAAAAEWPSFAADIEQTLALYDGIDGRCGNQWLAERAELPTRYRRLAATLADDRLWVDSGATACTRFLAVELAELATPGSSSGDCGGRAPTYDAVDVFRSLLVGGKSSGVDDGVEGDDGVPSLVAFPFLAAP